MNQNDASQSENLSFQRYLAAKKEIDDQALNHHVFQSLEAVTNSPSLTADRPLRILEIGAGIGTMVERLLERRVLKNAYYTALDADPDNIRVATDRIERWVQDRGWKVDHTADLLHVIRSTGCQSAAAAQTVQLRHVIADVFDFLSNSEETAAYDLLIGHAVLDLFDLSRALPILLHSLRPHGYCYFTIVFDGITSFQPSVDPDLDDLIERLYHRTMDERHVDGRPSAPQGRPHRSGRLLLSLLQQHGLDLLATGSSDWIVHPRHGGYEGDRAYFLRHILHFVEDSLTGHPQLDQQAFQSWLRRRHQQIRQGKLIYIAHQIDVLARDSQNSFDPLQQRC